MIYNLLVVRLGFLISWQDGSLVPAAISYKDLSQSKYTRVAKKQNL
jgi:hypothetical protein